MAYKRVVLKISGEALSNGSENIDFSIVRHVAHQVAELVKMGLEVCVIIGGGNIWRGRQGKDMNRVTADHMGMLATVINSLAFQDTLESLGVPARLQTAIEMKQIAEPFIRRKAVRHLEKGRVVIFACGTGNPYFTTDMAAALRAAEMEADLILLAKNVDGIYDSDPKINKDAKKYDEISYMDFISQNLKAMDTTAVTLCMENNIPILAFGLSEEDGIIRAAKGEKIGTIIK
ncbi:MAG: UMP kinase [Clostridia bacterium]|nr:UMP kinase [Clostridia bacterium]